MTGLRLYHTTARHRAYNLCKNTANGIDTYIDNRGLPRGNKELMQFIAHGTKEEHDDCRNAPAPGLQAPGNFTKSLEQQKTQDEVFEDMPELSKQMLNHVYICR